MAFVTGSSGTLMDSLARLDLNGLVNASPRRTRNRTLGHDWRCCCHQQQERRKSRLRHGRTWRMCHRSICQALALRLMVGDRAEQQTHCSRQVALTAKTVATRRRATPTTLERKWNHSAQDFSHECAVVLPSFPKRPMQ